MDIMDMVDEYQTLAHHLLFDKLQNSFGRIEDSAKSMKRSALHFPATNEWILQELYLVKNRVDGLIDAFETLEKT
jgi:hypothetical protein